jgi:hypothetical protein
MKLLSRRAQGAYVLLTLLNLAACGDDEKSAPDGDGSMPPPLSDGAVAEGGAQQTTPDASRTDAAVRPDAAIEVSCANGCDDGKPCTSDFCVNDRCVHGVVHSVCIP